MTANCWGTGITLGEADSYQVVTSSSLKAVFAKIEVDDFVKHFLLTAGPNGNPQVEEISGLLAASAGLAPWSRGEEVSVDAAGFAAAGNLSVRRRGRSAGAALEAATSTSQFDVVKHLAESRRLDAQAQEVAR